MKNLVKSTFKHIKLCLIYSLNFMLDLVNVYAWIVCIHLEITISTLFKKQIKLTTAKANNKINSQ